MVLDGHMILLTGGAGFIGSNLVAALTERGEPVAVCDRLRDAGKWRNLARVPLRELIAPEALLEWLPAQGARIEAIVHMGAISSTTEADADLITAVNFRLPQALWRWCASAGKRFIYASSAATYGLAEHGFDDDPSPQALARLRPLNPYGWSKHLFDRWVAQVLEEGGPRPPQWVGLKFFNVYGPNEYHKGGMRSVVTQKYPLAAAGNPVTLFRSHRVGVADGAQKRDFIYVRDCIEVMLWLLDHPEVNGLFNLGTGRARSFEELARALCTALERPVRLEYVEMPAAVRAHYQYFTEARMERLRAAGYTQAFTPLEEGVRDYVQRYLSQPDPYR
ncbi:MAG TPA: ADP-glyceromanno-heptose 6-epimerase [Steroidobacteraceae bacterium]|jgi:ADP-L-glycero-D-manno-heptose 6-epimerase|nr:ADP-glyceromanno-heptose 6-epimerase [Steroidobacteraceae bacterium]